ncbi:type IV secretion system DNA-binding domain-containing protein [Candidatus Microgenomates bacterium]|nr:type IV secretion system DNA-binding domain-containing protein [Candidatus Microgenomates bacterium]
MPNFSHLQVRLAKDDETPIEAATQIFASLLSAPWINPVRWAFVRPKPYSFEIYLINQVVYMYVTVPEDKRSLVESLIISSFPKSQIAITGDPMGEVLKAKNLAVGEIKLNSYSYLPVKTYMDFQDVDPLSALVGFMGKQDPDTRICIQVLITPASFPWQSKAINAVSTQVYDPASGRYGPNPMKILIDRKISFQGGRAVIRLLVGRDGGPARPILQNLAGTFGAFSLGEGNQFVSKRVLRPKRFLRKMQNRSVLFLERKNQILNAQELATIWHPPGFLLAGVRNMNWGKTLLGEAPTNLPAAQTASDEDKKDINFFAKTNYRNQESIFGIKTADRRRHTYIIGKTGTGKSTLIANMAIDDIRKDRGVGIIDPHGDLSEIILDYIPARRMNDVIYLEPFDTERPFSLNVLEVQNKQQKDLVASGIISIFHKIYKESWGPRLEYILRNVIITLLDTPGSTLVDVLRILTDNKYREGVVANLTDPVLKNFWEKEFARMSDNFRSEAISPIQNKVGQFVSSRMVRNIVGNSKSTIDLEAIMNEGKILILNLSQGKLGEDNAALLGAMIITQIQLAAMNRSFTKEEERRDFFLYVDEFQNFATSSFGKILSEARKYRLSLILANQYIDQLEEEISKAIFGNVGTLISFVVGAGDAKVLTFEFGELYTENDLVSLGKYETVVRLSIDNMTTMPFPATTLPLPALKNENRDKIKRLSKEKYGHKPIV